MNTLTAELIARGGAMSPLLETFTSTPNGLALDLFGNPLAGPGNAIAIYTVTVLPEGGGHLEVARRSPVPAILWSERLTGNLDLADAFAYGVTKAREFQWQERDPRGYYQRKGDLERYGEEAPTFLVAVV